MPIGSVIVIEVCISFLRFYCQTGKRHGMIKANLRMTATVRRVAAYIACDNNMRQRRMGIQLAPQRRTLKAYANMFPFCSFLNPYRVIKSNR